MTTNIELRHGIRLTITGALGNGGFTVLADFFAEAMKHFKQLRDVVKQPLYAQSFQRRYRVGRKGSVSFELSHPSPLPTGLWVDAVVSGYTVANTLEQTKAEFKAVRESSDRDGGSMNDLLALIEAGDVLGAFEKDVKDSAVSDQEAGLYEPGIVYAETYAKFKAAGNQS